MFVELWDRKVGNSYLKAGGTLGCLDWCSLSSPSRNYCTCRENPQISTVKQQALWKMNSNTSLKREKKKCMGEEVREVASQHEIIPTKKISGHFNMCFWWRIKSGSSFTHPHWVQRYKWEMRGQEKRKKKKKAIGSEYISCHTLHINKWMNLTGLSSTH